MSDTDQSAENKPAARKRTGGLSGMLLADLRSMAGQLAIEGAGSMKKAALVEAIKAAQAEQGPTARPAAKPPEVAADSPAAKPTASPTASPTDTPAGQAAVEAGSEPAVAEAAPVTVTTRRRGSRATAATRVAPAAEPPAPTPEPEPEARSAPEPAAQPEPEPAATPEATRETRHRTGRETNDDPTAPAEPPAEPPAEERATAARDAGHTEADDDAEGETRTGRNRRRRGRDRNRQGTDSSGSSGSSGQSGQPGQQSATGTPSHGQSKQSNQGGQSGQGGHHNQGGQNSQSNQSGQSGQGGYQRGGHEPDTSILDDDVLVPAAGILDVLDNYAFVRTSGYLPGVDDVYVSLSMVRRFGLRRGDAVVGQVRQPREGERKEKFNPMVRIDAVNGLDPDAARTRPEFASLTPVHPDTRLRLEGGTSDGENTPDAVVLRVIDLLTPLAKGQRGLVVGAGDTGKTTLLQTVSQALSANHPECHQMIVLVDQRPEEVTDFQRTVKGEVVASTFDRPAGDHTIVADLSVERAKRLVELGHDVVILLDGVVRLARAYQQSAPTSGRTGGGTPDGVLYQLKRFFGAGRALAEGGSLTVIVTAAPGGTEADASVLEELLAAATLEVRLREDLAAAGRYPALDAAGSRARRTELLLGPEEQALVRRVRGDLLDAPGADAGASFDRLTAGLRDTRTNVEFLTKLGATGGQGTRTARREG